jgi:hypothetical protein
MAHTENQDFSTLSSEETSTGPTPEQVKAETKKRNSDRFKAKTKDEKEMLKKLKELGWDNVLSVTAKMPDSPKIPRSVWSSLDMAAHRILMLKVGQDHSKVTWKSLSYDLFVHNLIEELYKAHAYKKISKFQWPGVVRTAAMTGFKLRKAPMSGSQLLKAYKKAVLTPAYKAAQEAAQENPMSTVNFQFYAGTEVLVWAGKEYDLTSYKTNGKDTPGYIIKLKEANGWKTKRMPLSKIKDMVAMQASLEEEDE